MVRHVVGDAFEQVRQVELHRSHRSRSGVGRPTLHSRDGLERRRLVQDDGFVPKDRYTSPEFARLEVDRVWGRVWQIACREEELPETGRLRRVRDRGSVDPGRAGRGRCDPGLSQRVPAPRHAPGRGRGLLRRGLRPVPLPRLAVRARRPPDRGGRRARVHRPARGPPTRDRAGRVLGRFRLREPRSRGRAAARVPRPAAHAARAVPARGPPPQGAAQHRVAGELEERRRRVQRELPRAGHAPADPGVDRRREHRLRAARQARALRAAGRRAARAEAEPAARAARRRVRRG